MSRLIKVMGVVLFLALSLFSNVTYAAGSPSFGPQTYQVHKYYYFGDNTYSSTARQGIDISVDESSVSYQSVKATVTMDWNLINDRQITKFIILANGINVDEFEPYWDTSLSPPAYKEYYYLDVNVSNQYIGSEVYFQVVAIHQDNINTPTNQASGNVYVTGWSQQSPSIHLKPLPVIDRDAGLKLDTNNNLTNTSNSLLEQILAKLEQLRAMLEGKLEQIDKSIREIYEIKPETQTRFDAALSGLQAKLPTTQVQDKVDQLSSMMNDSSDQIKNAPNDLKFGNVSYMGVINAPLLDFTELADSVEKLRMLMEVTLWIAFFIFVIRIMVPKLTA